MTQLSKGELYALLAVAQLYLDCLDSDPENEVLTVIEALMVTELRDVVSKYDPDS